MAVDLLGCALAQVESFHLVPLALRPITLWLADPRKSAQAVGGRGDDARGSARRWRQRVSEAWVLPQDRRVLTLLRVATFGAFTCTTQRPHPAAALRPARPGNGVRAA